MEKAKVWYVFKNGLVQSGQKPPGLLLQLSFIFSETLHCEINSINAVQKTTQRLELQDHNNVHIVYKVFLSFEKVQVAVAPPHAKVSKMVL